MKYKYSDHIPFYQKLNYNCPASYKDGEGEGSCKGYKPGNQDYESKKKRKDEKQKGVDERRGKRAERLLTKSEKLQVDNLKTTIDKVKAELASGKVSKQTYKELRLAVRDVSNITKSPSGIELPKVKSLSPVIKPPQDKTPKNETTQKYDIENNITQVLQDIENNGVTDSMRKLLKTPLSKAKKKYESEIETAKSKYSDLYKKQTEYVMSHNYDVSSDEYQKMKSETDAMRSDFEKLESKIQTINGIQESLRPGKVAENYTGFNSIAKDVFDRSKQKMEDTFKTSVLNSFDGIKTKYSNISPSLSKPAKALTIASNDSMRKLVDSLKGEEPVAAVGEDGIYLNALKLGDKKYLENTLKEEKARISNSKPPMLSAGYANNPEEYVKIITDHEQAHMIQNKYLSDIPRDDNWQDIFDRRSELSSKLNEAFNQADADGWRPTFYIDGTRVVNPKKGDKDDATRLRTHYSESFAEAFALRENGKRDLVHPEVNKVMDEYLSDDYRITGKSDKNTQKHDSSFPGFTTPSKLDKEVEEILQSIKPDVMESIKKTKYFEKGSEEQSK